MHRELHERVYPLCGALILTYLLWENYVWLFYDKANAIPMLAILFVSIMLCFSGLSLVFLLDNRDSRRLERLLLGRGALRLLSYFHEHVVIGLLVVCLSLAIPLVMPRYWGQYFVGFWIFVFIYFLLTTYRIFWVLLDTIFRRHPRIGC